MKKVVVKTGGDSIGIRFNVEERKAHGITEGDIIEVTEENISNILSKQRQDEKAKEIKELVENGNY